MWLVITCYSSYLTFQSSIKSESSKTSQSSTIISTPRVQSSPVPSNLYRECNPVSLVQLHQISTASQPNSNSTLSSTTLKVKGNRLPKFSLKLGSKNQLDQPPGLRISYLTTTISRLQRRLKLPHSLYWTQSIIKQFTNQGNCKGISIIQYNFHFHGAYSR